MKIITNKTFDEERALYDAHDIVVRDCAFDGPADGESAFKECGNITVEHCFFNLRYPFWHDKGNSSAIKIEPIKNNRKSAEIFQPLCNDFSTINFIFTSNLGLQRGHGILCV